MVILTSISIVISESTYTNHEDIYENRAYGLIEDIIKFVLAYNQMIPIYLFLTMDLVRFLQCIYIQKITKNAVVFNTGDVNEDLGQVEYVLADKTGIITESESLKLVACAVDEYIYWASVKENNKVDFKLTS